MRNNKYLDMEDACDGVSCRFFPVVLNDGEDAWKCSVCNHVTVEDVFLDVTPNGTEYMEETL